MVLVGALSFPQQSEGAYPVALPSAPQRANAAKQYLARILGGNRYRATPVPGAPQGKLAAGDGHDTPTSVLCPTALAKHACHTSASACSTSSSGSLIKAAEDCCYTPLSSKTDMQCDDTRDQDFGDAADHPASTGVLSSSGSSCATCMETPASPCSQASMATVDDADILTSSSGESSPHHAASAAVAAQCGAPQASLTSEFLQMQSLTYLTIQNMNFVTFNQQDMECLASCTGLTRLHWTDNSDLPEGGVATALATLCNLSHLHLDTKACKAHEVLPHCHASLSRLTSLTLLSGDAHLALQRPVQWAQLSALQCLRQLTLRPAPEMTKIKQWLPCLTHCKFPDVDSAGISEYLHELHGKERTSWVRSGSMVGLQREVTLGMRAVLVDWLIEIADEWRLQWESLHLGVALLDKFLASRRVPRRSLQLLAVTCLWEGAKFHELHPPTSRECARLVDSKCHWRDVVRMEQTVLEVVGFDMGVPTVSTFLHAYMAGIAQDELVPSFAKYFCDLAIIHYSTTRFPPSFLAAAALWLAVGLGRMHAPEACVVPGLKQGQKELTAAVQELVTAYKWASYGAGRSSYVQQKYSHRRFHRVAKLPLTNANLTA